MVLSLVAVHAHPDDESLSMGGTLARYAAAGVRVTVITATLGEQGEVRQSALAGLTAERSDQLGGYRYTELRSACAALGADFQLLGGIGRFRDSGMAGSDSARRPRAFVRAGADGPDHDLAIGLLASAFDELAPDVVLTYAADGGYGHPDHVAAHQVAVAAAPPGIRVCAVVKPRQATLAALAELPVPPGYRPGRGEDLGFLVDDADVAVPLDAPARGRRGHALAAHASQLDLLPGGFALTNLVAQPLLPVEYYRLLAGPPLPAGADDLFAGLA